MSQEQIENEERRYFEEQRVQKHIAAALVKAQTAFGPALKSSSNPHFRSKYADLSTCVEAVIDALNANGIALIQRTHPCQTGVIVETVFIHESGDFYSAGTLHVPAQKNDAQGYGSALTYARRYSLMAACGIAPEDDDGNAASRKPAPKPLPTADVGSVDRAAQAILEAIAENDSEAVNSIFKSLSDQEKAAIWVAKTKGGYFTQEEKEFIRSSRSQGA